MLTNWGWGVLAREAQQQQAKRERAGQGKANGSEVAKLLHGENIARTGADWQPAP